MSVSNGSWSAARATGGVGIRELAALDLVEQVVDHLLVRRADEEDVLALPPVRDLGAHERVGERHAVRRRPLGQVVLGARHAVGERDRVRRVELVGRFQHVAILARRVVVGDPEPSLDVGDHEVGRLLRLLGDDELGALPSVRHLGVGQLRGELGLLVERPPREVVDDTDRVRVGWAPVGHRGLASIPATLSPGLG